MESAFAWIGQIAQFLGSFIPRLVIVMSSHRAVKYVHGKKVILLEPGLHIYWPLVTEFETCAVVRQVLKLQTQVIETKDGVPVVVGGVVVYEIEDAIKFLAENENAYQTIDDIATAAIRKVIINNDFSITRNHQKSLESKLTKEVQKLLTPFGVSVEYVRLVDFCKTRVTHLSGINLENLTKIG